MKKRIRASVAVSGTVVGAAQLRGCAGGWDIPGGVATPGGLLPSAPRVP
jgi:hypothetical protein